MSWPLHDANAIPARDVARVPERVRLILELQPGEGPVFGHLERPGDDAPRDFRGYVALITAIEDARRAAAPSQAAKAQGDGS